MSTGTRTGAARSRTAGGGREFLRLTAGALAFLALALLMRNQFETLRAWLAGLGRWAPFAFLGVHAIAVALCFPVAILGFLAGASFGFLGGTLVLVVGGLLSASVIYALARGILAERVRRYAASRSRLARFLDLAQQDSLRLMVLLRLSPLHYALVCYLLGAGRVRYWPYLLTSALILPSAAMQAYVGETARVMGDRVRAGESLGVWQLALSGVAVVAAILLVVVLGRLLRRAFAREFGDPTGGEGAV